MREHKGRLFSFRGGDRSEYLSLYILTSIAYVIPVPRQEDFGVADFLCFLGKHSNSYLYGEDAFLLQTKSSDESFDFNEDATSYLKNHANLPFLLGVTDKTSQKMKVYSSWRLWYYLMVENEKNIKTIRYTPDVYTFKEGQYERGYRYQENDLSLEIALGKPIISLSLDCDVHNSSTIYEVLKFWLQVELANIVALKTHKAFFQGASCWETNCLPAIENMETYYGTGMEDSALERASVDCLTALAFNYENRGTGKQEALQKISEVLRIMPERYLNVLGRKYRDMDFSRKNGEKS